MLQEPPDFGNRLNVEFIVRPISIVLSASRPSAIFRRVVPLVVDTVDLQAALEPRLHGPCHEAFGIVFPLVTELDSSPSVIVECAVFWIKAT